MKNADHIMYVHVCVCRTFISSLSRGRGVFGASVKFTVDGEETTEYDPRTFYSGELEGTNNIIMSVSCEQ